MNDDQLSDYKLHVEKTFATKDSLHRLDARVVEHGKLISEVALDTNTLKVELKNIGFILNKINSHMEWAVRLILAAIIGLILKAVLGI